MNSNPFGFYEFFAGGGMARIGLGDRWRCLFANEWCDKKAESYRRNHNADRELAVRDVAEITLDDLKGRPLLAWASFPCQDLSLAGSGKGLAGKRSGTFHPFWKLMSDLAAQGRPLPMIVLENVVGALTSNKGRDFQAIAEALQAQGYNFGPMVINAADLIPQSRPRLFIIAVKSNIPIDKKLVSDSPISVRPANSILKAYESLDKRRQQGWIWWNLPIPGPRKFNLLEIIEEEPNGTGWHPKAYTEKILNMMSERNLAKVKSAQTHNKAIVGTVYKRTRKDENGGRVQRAEVRFDQISGCLRTPAGGSSRQIIMIVEGETIKTRLITPREAARLMGLDDSYILPNNYNEAYRLVGDGLAVPVVSHLSKHLLTPIAETCAELGL